MKRKQIKDWVGYNRSNWKKSLQENGGIERNIQEDINNIKMKGSQETLKYGNPTIENNRV